MTELYRCAHSMGLTRRGSLQLLLSLAFVGKADAASGLESVKVGFLRHY